MTNRKFFDDTLQSLSESVTSLDSASRQLSEVMTRQLDAVIASDADMVQQMTEQNISALQNFQESEKEFIRDLHNCIPKDADDELRITLETLKSTYPAYSEYINDWQVQIAGNITRLQMQQENLVQLLDFAQAQNASLMRSVYGLQSSRNMHYRQNGETSGVPSGIALNQEG